MQAYREPVAFRTINACIYFARHSVKGNKYWTKITFSTLEKNENALFYFSYNRITFTDEYWEQIGPRLLISTLNKDAIK